MVSFFRILEQKTLHNLFEAWGSYITIQIGGEEGVILEEDSEDEEGYMFAGNGTLDMFHVVACTSCA